MSDELERRLYEDRAIRDAAKALVRSDVDNLRGDLKGRSVGSRVNDRLSEGAMDLFGEAKIAAEEHRGIVAGVVGAIVLLFASGPLVDLFTSDEGEEDDDEIEEERRGRSLFGW